MTVLYALSFVLMMCGLTQGIAGVVDISSGTPILDSIFFLSGSVVISLGLLLYFFTQNRRRGFKIKEMFAVTTFSWILFALFSSFPFYFSGVSLSFTDAFFESMSGLTTTGASIIPNVEALPHSMLFFRSLLQWIGGAGIIVVALLVLPVLSMGGMHFFTTESSEQNNKMQPKISKNMADIFTAFVLLTAACFACLALAGMSLFDALNHAMTCIATGGFSTHNNSIAYFNSPAIEWILTLFMFLAGFPLLMWSLLKRGQLQAVADNKQIFLYIKCVIVIILFTTLWRLKFFLGDISLDSDILRTTAFHVVSVMTSTGFITENYVLWGPFAVALFIFLMLTIFMSIAFVFFANLPQYVKEPYRRFLENKLREWWDFTGTPVQLFIRAK